MPPRKQKAEEDGPWPARVRLMNLAAALWWLGVTAYVLYQFAAPDNKRARVFVFEVTRNVYNVTTNSVVAEPLATISPLLLMFGFGIMTCAFHLARFIMDARAYDQAVIHRSDVTQFVEYAGSSTLMLLAITLVTRVSDIATLVPVMAGNVVVMLLGAAAEAQFAKVERLRRQGTPEKAVCKRSWGLVLSGMSWFLWLAIWVPSGLSFFSSIAAAPAASDIPTYVWLIWLALFGMHLGFPSLFTYRSIIDAVLAPVTDRAQRVTRDMRVLIFYIVLSIANKSMLVALVTYANMQLPDAFVNAATDLAVESGYAELSMHAFFATGYIFVALLMVRLLDRRLHVANKVDLSGPMGPKLGLFYLALDFVPAGWVMYQTVFDAGERAYVPGLMLAIYIATQALYAPAYEDFSVSRTRGGVMRWCILQVISLVAFGTMVGWNFLSPVWGTAMPWNRIVGLVMGVVSLLAQAIIDGVLVLKYMVQAVTPKNPSLAPRMSTNGERNVQGYAGSGSYGRV